MAVLDIVPTYDGYASLAPVASFSKFPNGSLWNCGHNDTGSSQDIEYRAFLKFPLSGLGQNIVVTKVELLLTAANRVGTPSVNFGAYEKDVSPFGAGQDPELRTGSDIFNDCDVPPSPATHTYLTGQSLPATSVQQTYVLGNGSSAQACVDLMAALAAGKSFWAVAIAHNTFSHNTGDHFGQLWSRLASTTTNRPVLRVTYTTGPNVPIVTVDPVGPDARPLFGLFFRHPGLQDGDAFQIIVYQDDGTTQVHDSGTVSQTASTLTFMRWAFPTSPALTPGTFYRAKARVRSAVDQIWSDYSDVNATRFKVDPGPNVPTALTPTGGAKAASTTPTLSWDYIHPDLEPISDSIIEIRKNSDDSLVQTKYLATVYDDFNRADGALGGSNALTGQAWAMAMGVHNIVSNRVQWNSTNGFTVSYLNAASAELRIVVTLDQSGGTQAAGIAFRVAQTNPHQNYFAVAVGTNGWTLFKVVNNTPTTLATGIFMQSGASRHAALTVEIRTSGSTGLVALSIGGLSMGSLVDSDLKDNTRCGLFFDGTSGSNALAIDEFRVFRTDTGQTSEQAKSYTVSPALTVGTEYKWRAKVRDFYKLTAYSSYAVFTPIAPPTVSYTGSTTITVNNPTLTWDYNGTTAQSKYQVLVFAADGTTVLYDSGQVVSANESHQVPAGILENNRSYELLIRVWDSDNLQADTGNQPVGTSWALPNSPATITVTPNTAGGFMGVTWATGDLSSSDFKAYHVYRRLATETVPVKIAVIEVQASTGYNDYFAPLNVSLVYSVTQVQDYAEEEVESTHRTATATTLTSEGAWLNNVDTPSSLNAQLQYDPERDYSREQSFADVQYWGKEKPTRHYGQAEFREARLTYVFDDRTLVDKVEALVVEKRPVAVRDTRGRVIFALLEDFEVRDRMPSLYEVSVSAREVEYSELQV